MSTRSRASCVARSVCGCAGAASPPPRCSRSRSARSSSSRLASPPPPPSPLATSVSATCSSAARARCAASRSAPCSCATCAGRLPCQSGVSSAAGHEAIRCLAASALRTQCSAVLPPGSCAAALSWLCMLASAPASHSAASSATSSCSAARCSAVRPSLDVASRLAVSAARPLSSIASATLRSCQCRAQKTNGGSSSGHCTSRVTSATVASPCVIACSSGPSARSVASTRLPGRQEALVWCTRARSMHATVPPRWSALSRTDPQCEQVRRRSHEGMWQSSPPPALQHWIPRTWGGHILNNPSSGAHGTICA